MLQAAPLDNSVEEEAQREPETGAVTRGQNGDGKEEKEGHKPEAGKARESRQGEEPGDSPEASGSKKKERTEWEGA